MGHFPDRITDGYGCNLGPAQTSKHMRSLVTPHMLSFVNRRHVTAQKIDAAIRDILNQYNTLSLPKLWGDGKTAAADGTMFDLYEENLLSEYHIRYGGYGGIAYHHISDTYIALFSHFIPCGVWEAVYIIDGLLKNKSSIYKLNSRVAAAFCFNNICFCPNQKPRTDIVSRKNKNMYG